MARNTCKTCGRKCMEEYCVWHKSKKPLVSKNKFKKGTTQEDIDEMYEFFMSIWKKRKHVSEVSGEKISMFSPANHHHILHKETHPYAKLDEENIIILSLQEHANVHLDMYRYEEINKRREMLIKKYELK